MVPDYCDFYIKSPEIGGSYSDTDLIEDDIIRIIVQKYMVILYTNKGEVLGNPDMGCNLEELVFNTKINEGTLKDIIDEQIFFFIPELANMNYNLELQFVQDDVRYRDILFINFTINDYEVYNVINQE